MANQHKTNATTYYTSTSFLDIALRLMSISIDQEVSGRAEGQMRSKLAR